MSIFRAHPHRSLVDPILKTVRDNPGKVVLTFMENNEDEIHVTAGELHRQARRYARILEDRGIQAGELVLLAMEHSLELVFAFWGILYTGAIPSIFSYKGPMATAASYCLRVKETALTAGARLVITSPALTKEMKQALANTNCPVYKPSNPGEQDAPESPLDYMNPGKGEDIAYVQYTSGTSGKQKGVELCHRAILNLVQSGASGLEINQKDVMINWLPLYHDFGLFAGFISPLFYGIPLVLISPYKWVRKPGILLQAIHKHGGTISFLPNSGHSHIQRWVPERETEKLNLASLRALINGAEPVIYQTQRAFLERFAPQGLRESALVCGYGMAENTLCATASLMGKRSPVDWVDAKIMSQDNYAKPVIAHSSGAIANVGCGVVQEGMKVTIMDPAGNELPDRKIGEILIESYSLFSGYRNNPDLTQQVLKDDRYYTGDMGYMVAGELFVCGRKRDLIILGGHNIYPQDLESAAAEIPGIKEDRVAAFGVTDKAVGTEKIVLVCGLEKPVSREEECNLERQVRRKIFSLLEVTPGDIQLVPKNWVVKTANGKMARGKNREKYLAELKIK